MDVVIVTPTGTEIDMMSELTIRQILSNNKVITVACK